VTEARKGHLFGIGAYVAWRFLPLYFKGLRPAGPIEILAHRVIWSALFVALLLTTVRAWRRMGALLRRPRTVLVVGLAAALIAINWATYIYGVNTDRVVETSLGYFITPLISVTFGLLVFGERLRPAQWGALAIGASAVAVLAVDYGRLPWIALTLACSFASYGLVKKRLGLPAADGLFAESAALSVPALGYLAWLSSAGRSTFTTVSAWHTVLLLVSGAVTAIPLLMFAGAANRIPMVSLGILQYIAPILQFFVGVAIEHEPMPPARLFGFALVWLALVIFTWDGLRSARRTDRTLAEAAGTGTTTAATTTTGTTTTGTTTAGHLAS
jgi:chloramphenicol-sensitive protein RarD